MALTEQEGRAEAESKKPLVVITEEDIVFHCEACGGELVVHRDGAGMTFPCLHCGHKVTVPPYQSRSLARTPAAPAAPTPVAVTPANETPPPTPAVVRHFDFSALSYEDAQRRFGDLQHQLKENRSQDTEMRGHVNRATIELHRLQLKLKKLQERQGDIEAEIAALRARLAPLS